jgi:hypothetical protein
LRILEALRHQVSQWPSAKGSQGENLQCAALRSTVAKASQLSKTLSENRQFEQDVGAG